MSMMSKQDIGYTTPIIYGTTFMYTYMFCIIKLSRGSTYSIFWKRQHIYFHLEPKLHKVIYNYEHNQFSKHHIYKTNNLHQDTYRLRT